MREQSKNIVDVRNQSQKQRMQRIKQKRLDRKRKLILKGYVIEQVQSISSQNSCNDKTLCQKLKNRQAAQKSRQQKKQYIVSLQQEVKQLRQQLALSRYCENCQKQLQINLQSEQNNLLLRPRSSMIQIHETEVQPEIRYDDESEFMRVSSTQQGSSIGIYLFLCMIILGVFCMGSRIGTEQAFEPMKRDLQQAFYSQQPNFADQPLSSSSNLIQPYDYSTNMKSTYSTIDSPNGLVSMDQAISNKLLFNQLEYENIIASFQNHRIDSEDKNLRSKISVIENNKSLLFCSRPVIYKSKNNMKNEDGILTAFIDIFVKGAEIVNIFSQSSQIDSNKIQLHGLYKISASVQEIEQIGNSNFIY